MVSSTPTSLPTSCQRRVSFKGTVLVHGVLHLKDYTEKELKACWYDRAGMERIRKHARYTLKQFRVLQEEDEESSELTLTATDKDLCLRGLEGYTEKEMTQKQRRRFEAIDLVLEIQETQFVRHGKIVCNEAIARAYAKVTEKSRRIARGWGIVHEHELSLSLKDSEQTNTLGYKSSSISAARCRLAMIKESSKLLDQSSWKLVGSQAA